MDKIDSGDSAKKTPDFRAYFDNRYTPRSVQEDALKFCESSWVAEEEEGTSEEGSSDISGEEGQSKAKKKEKNVVALSGPCGIGKSLIALTISNYNAAHGLTTAYITPQKSLQTQLNNEFPEINCFMGRDNYPCLLYPKDKEMNANAAVLMNLCKSCLEIEVCPYMVKKNRCYNENITVFNPLSYIYLGKEEGIYHANTMIIDEAQSVVSMLCGVFDFKIWHHEFRYPTGVSASIPSVVDLLDKYRDNLKMLNLQFIDIKERLRITRNIRRVEMVIDGLQSSPELFVVEECRELYLRTMSDCLKVRVVAPPGWLLGWFFKGVKNVVVMSGTLFKRDIHELGFKNYHYIDLPSPIDPERRRFIPLGVVNNNYNNEMVIAQLGDAILKLAEKHPNERGLVLATYAQAKGLSEYLAGRERFVFHDKESKKETIDKFMSGEGKDTIAVLSGAWEGLDAKDDLARFIIITKCPYPNMADKVVKRKMDLDPSWYGMEAMKFIIQGANRASRNEKDFSVTYMLDSNFARLYAQTKPQLPKYFIESIKWGQKL